VLSCPQRARLFASAFTEVVVEAAAFEAPIHGDIASVLHIVHPIFILFCNICLRVCGASSLTRCLAFFLVLKVNFVVMSPFPSASSGFCAHIMSAAFSSVTLSGMLYMITLGFLFFWMLISSWSLH
jgi:hypothetical protein